MSTPSTAAGGLPDLKADADQIADMAGEMIARLRRHGGGPDGSVTRLAYTPEWQSAMSEVEGWFEQFGLECHVDAVGSRFGRLQGEGERQRAGGRGPDGEGERQRAGGRGPDGQRPEVVLTGSHIDSVASGGAYDGALGVVMATCAAAWLAENCEAPQRTLEVLANCEEESSRFPGNLWGARAMVGLIAPDEPVEVRDQHGVAIGDAMRECGLDPNRIPDAVRRDIAAFLEPHIEQGTVLERAGSEIGLVDRVVGVRQLEFVFEGASGHAGTIPVRHRRDPLVGASKLVLAARETAVRIGHPGVATVGIVQVEPGGANQVPGRVRMTIDFRHTELAALDRMESELRAAAKAAAVGDSLGLSITSRVRQRPIGFDSKIGKLLESACQRQARKWMWLPSGAGHDAQVLATRYPAAMLFLPSKGGHSHRPDEETDIQHVAAGIQVLIEALYHLLYEAP